MAWIKQVSQVGRSRIAVPTFKPDLAEMRRIQATIRGCSNCRSTIYAGSGIAGCEPCELDRAEDARAVAEGGRHEVRVDALV